MEKITPEQSLYRVIDKVIPGNRDTLMERVNSSEPLKIKFGTDPTGSGLHFGHAVNLWAMRAMQERGHKVDLVIGDVTARIGDPTGRNQERTELSENEVAANADMFLRQIQMVLLGEPDVFEIHRNSKWYQSMNAIEFIDKTLRRATLAMLTARNDFRARIDANLPIHGHELVYQLLQGYDSVHLKTDIAMCGDDQLTNELMGRHLQQSSNLSPQEIVTTRLTPGIDGGRKQSKSVGNYIGLTHSPEEQYRRIMSIPDPLISDYFEVYTDLLTSQLRSMVAQSLSSNPRDLKMTLAKEMLRRYHKDEIIEQAAESYARSAASGAPDDVPTHIINAPIDLVAFAVKNLKLSKSEFIRLVKGGAVSIDGKKIAESDLVERELSLEITRDIVVKYGKNKWVKLKPSQF